MSKLYLKVVALATHPDAKGRGLGRQIMEAVVQRADEEGMHVSVCGLVCLSNAWPV